MILASFYPWPIDGQQLHVTNVSVFTFKARGPKVGGGGIHSPKIAPRQVLVSFVLRTLSDGCLPLQHFEALKTTFCLTLYKLQRKHTLSRD